MSQSNGGADTIRILVATDNHVGYNERDAHRGNDSWITFDEIMKLAKREDVDMVLLAGDLFHENKPSRMAMHKVMTSLRDNCYGDKPCQLEMLSDGTENFEGVFNHVNYEDENINVAIPVFSIHGNHDDPSGVGHYAALDLLSVAGLVNYYGKAKEADNISVKPLLLQKGRTKLALYGLSNVRDERLFRTFRDQGVKFYQPGTQKNEWFNLMSVHQNHHARTDTGYLPESFLPDFLDLVIWGHEHECLIEPRYNPEMGFHVIQPGSSIATSLIPGEAVEKYVTILSVTGKSFDSQPIRLKTVRPFLMKDVVLREEKSMIAIAKKENNRPDITRFLMGIVDGMIEEAIDSWLAIQEKPPKPDDIPRPIIRLRVEYTAPEGGKFDCENPQRFSNRFSDKVANQNDVVHFHRKKTSTGRKARNDPDMPEESVLAQLSIDTVKVEKLVREFLMAQSLTILPQNSFGQAVSEFVDKDDKHAMETFVNDSLTLQVQHLMNAADKDDEDLNEHMTNQKTNMEQLFASGLMKLNKKSRLKPKPDDWDSDGGEHWADQPGALIRSDNEENGEEDDAESVASGSTAARGRVRGRGRAGKTQGSTRATASKGKKTTATGAGRGKKKAVVEEDDDEDVIMIDDDDEGEDDDSSLFVKQKPATKGRASRATTQRTASPVKKTSTRAAPSRSKQSTLNFSQPATQATQTNGRTKKFQEPSEDEISDDDDAFEPVPSTAGSSRARR
ncbi:MAG: meiotic recombination [Bogoriella megaspora]|nr:MAG: meiotic recombination [Bogoriella megaspora]